MLVAGGLDHATPITTALVYDLYFYDFQTIAALPTPRAAAAVLPTSSGKFVLYGGLVNTASGLAPTDLVEVYDATADTFASGQGGAGARAAASVTLFPDSTANWLIAGGTGPGGVALATAAVFSEATVALTATMQMTTPRVGHTATSVQTPRGPRIFIYGGTAASGFDAELFEPVARTFAPFAAPAALGHRSGHTASLLSDGRVLIVGGRDENGALRGDILLFDPQAPCDASACAAFTAVQDATNAPAVLTGPRYGHATFVLASGSVLVAAGRGPADAALKTAELFAYDAATKRLTRDPSPPPLLTSARADFASVGLSTGQILFAGGIDETGTPLHTAELYFPR